MRMEAIVEAARLCPEEFTVNDLVSKIPHGRGYVCDYNIKVELRQKLGRLSKFGIVERRNEGRFVYYRYVGQQEAVADD